MSSSRATTISVECRVARVRAVPVRVGVVGQTGQGGQQHRDDRRDEDDVGRRVLAEDVEDHRPEEQSDRKVGRRRMEWMTQPAAVEQIPDGFDGTEDRGDPAMVEFAEGSCPCVVECHKASEHSSHGVVTSLRDCTPTTGSVDAPEVLLHKPSTVVGNSGIRSRAPRLISWIRPLWPHTVTSTFRLARRGRCEPPEPHRGVILGTVSGARFEGRKASE